MKQGDVITIAWGDGPNCRETGMYVGTDRDGSLRIVGPDGRNYTGALFQPNKMAEKLRKVASGMGDEIYRCFAARQEHTYKKHREAQNKRVEGRELECVQDKLRALADLHDAGTVPAILSRLNSRKQVDWLLRANRLGNEDDPLRKAGITTQDEFEQAKRAIQDIGDPAKNGALTTADRLRDLEIEVCLKVIEGFFPTPERVANLLVIELAIEPDMGPLTLLEPSAGRGDLIEAALKVNPDLKVKCIEVNYDLCEILRLKGFDPVRRDFEEWSAFGGGEFDRILMNPPFEFGTDMKHVRIAYRHLKPGGRLVSVMAESAFTNSQKKFVDFRDWLDEVSAYDLPLPEGAFQDSDKPTGVRTRMVVIDKPAARLEVVNTETAVWDMDSGTLEVVEQGAPVVSASVTMNEPEQSSPTRSAPAPIVIEQYDGQYDIVETIGQAHQQMPLLPAQPLPSPVTLHVALEALDEEQYGRVDLRPKLVKSMRDVGQVVAVILLKTVRGYRIVDGLHRIRAIAEIARQNGDPAYVRADVYDEADGWSFDAVVGLIANSQRESNPVAELERIEALVADQHTLKEIAAETGMPVQTIQKRLKLSRLLPALRAAWEQGKIADGVAERIAVLPAATQRKLAGDYASMGKLTADNVREARQIDVKAGTAQLVIDTPGFEPVVSAEVSLARKLETVRELVRRGFAEKAEETLTALIETLGGAA